MTDVIKGKMQIQNTVIIITYNQEHLIGRALDSVLCQKEFVYEIIVSDDCSTDKTWEVIEEYKKKYPNIIKPFRNTVNMGIFEHLEVVRTRARGDVIWITGGDDEYTNGIFEVANKLIEKNSIDLAHEAFVLYFDYKTIDPNGKEAVFRNNLIEHYEPIGLKIRQLIQNRTVGFSRKILGKFYPVRKDIGIFADGLMDIQLQIFSDKNYYCRFIGSIYHTNIGISSRSNKSSLYESSIKSLKQLESDIPNISKEDKQWLNYRKIQCSNLYHPTFENYLLYLKYFFIVIQKYYGWKFIVREFKYIMRDAIRLILFTLKLRKRT